MFSCCSDAACVRAVMLLQAGTPLCKGTPLLRKGYQGNRFGSHPASSAFCLTSSTSFTLQICLYQVCYRVRRAVPVCHRNSLNFNQTTLKRLKGMEYLLVLCKISLSIRLSIHRQKSLHKAIHLVWLSRSSGVAEYWLQSQQI